MLAAAGIGQMRAITHKLLLHIPSEGINGSEAPNFG
jgi:hypothetical protein